MKNVTNKLGFPSPPDEGKRLEALNRYDILDTPQEKAFDRITEMATIIFDLPIALVSLIDKDRQWCKSCIGVNRRQRDREPAFCNIPVKTKKTTVIPDATKDERFKNNVLVTDSMNIRFYAGAPLITDDNHVLGTLCVIDTEPRQFSNDQITLLESLAQDTFSQLELRRQQNQNLKLSRQLKMLDRALASVREGISVSNPSMHDNPLVYVNDAFEEITRYAREDIIGKNCRFLQGEDTESEPVEKMREAIRNEEHVNVRVKNYRKDGEPFWNSVSISPVKDDDGNVERFIGVHQDITKYKMIEEHLELEAQHDRLTALLNRWTLIDRFETELERVKRYNGYLSFIFMDLDRFKQINDNHGHQTGDSVLKKIGKLINDHVRNSDIPGRYGGEEFGIVLPETDINQAETFANRLCKTIKKTTFETKDEESISVTASAGVAQLDYKNSTCSKIIEQADNALYMAKNQGRNQVVRAC
jgi:diguanylate cyclase (GGDEF)-like protein/PAS domain S-box-containing protein